MSKITMEDAEEVSWIISALDEHQELGATGLFHILTGVQNGLSIKRAIRYMKNELKKWYEAQPVKQKLL